MVTPLKIRPTRIGEGPRGRSPWLAGAAALVLLGVAAAGWALYRGSRTDPATARPLAIIVSGDTAGWIVPCGCASRQSGGLLRRGTFVARAGEPGNVLLADVGGAAGGSAPYERLKFKAILLGESAMGIDAHNIGASEAALGAAFLRQAALECKVPLVSTNVRDAAGKLVAEPLVIVRAGGRRIAIAGVLSRRYAAGGLQIDDPRTSVLGRIRSAQGDYDALMVLAYLPTDELQAFASSMPEADLVIGGPTLQTIAPRQDGPTLLASATNKGKFLVHLAARDLAGDPPGGMRFQGNIAELGPEIPDHAAQQSNLARFRKELARIDFTADETGLAPELPPELPEDYRIAGTAACRDCHQDDCRQWDASKHAHAWQTLLAQEANVDPYCQQCHTTGYGLPGGFVSARGGALHTSVGCESCHGPSLAHSQSSDHPTTYAASDRCVSCHDRENSPTFEYASFWPEIRHGTKPQNE